ncbi:hypothetical protein ABZP36_001653 [Zizania latifolia]
MCEYVDALKQKSSLQHDPRSVGDRADMERWNTVSSFLAFAVRSSRREADGPCHAAGWFLEAGLRRGCRIRETRVRLHPAGDGSAPWPVAVLDSWETAAAVAWRHGVDGRM